MKDIIIWQSAVTIIEMLDAIDGGSTSPRFNDGIHD